MTSGGNNFNDFPDNQLTKFRYLLNDPGFLPLPLNIYEASRFVLRPRPPEVRQSLRWSLTLIIAIYEIHSQMEIQVKISSTSIFSP